MSIQQLFSNAASRWPETLALHEPATGQKLTFWQINAALQGFGAFLAERGIACGARVGILADASIPYLIADYGSMACGYVRVPFDPSLSVEELRNQIADAEIAILLHDPIHAELAQQAGGAASVPLPTTWQTITAHTAAPQAGGSPSTLASLNYTGGTTGQPKAVMHTQGSLTAIVSNIGQARPTSAGDVLLNVRPLWPIASVSVLAHLCHGGTVVLGGRFNPSTFLPLLQTTHAAYSSLVPTQIARLVQHAQAHGAIANSQPPLPFFRSLDVGAASLPPETLEKAMHLFGPRLSILYGMTEAPWSFYLPAPELAALHQAGTCAGAVGFPLQHVQARLNAPSTQPHAGEVEIHGPHLMAGYWKQPKKTASVLHDGWLATGDLGIMDNTHMLKIVGRSKEIIRSGGMSVQPAEVVDCLLSYRGVAEAHVFGAADPEWGERVCAAIVLHANTELEADELILHCKKQLSRHKVPKQILFVPHLPRSHYGKVQQAKLLKLLEE
ncbi:MAG: class I adenylate-forming enzyme family protein [Acetobacter fabarum]|uniref:class I adenylate-forming enzyme family protein n=1 Tax=Acetobacter fabarum TaxID=483199 RepID=UPI0039EAD59F